MGDAASDVQSDRGSHDDAPEDYYISDLFNQLTQVIAAKPTEIEPVRAGKLLLKHRPLLTLVSVHLLRCREAVISFIRIY